MQTSVCGYQPTDVPYEISLVFVKNATNEDRQRVAAERLMAESELLLAEYRIDSSRAAVRKYEEAVEKFEGVGDYVEKANALIRIAKLYRDFGDTARASSYINRALTTSRNEPASTAEALLALATIELNQGETSKAIESCTRALNLSRSNSEARVEEAALNLLGVIHYETSDYAEAANLLEGAETIARNRHDSLGFARALLDLAAVDFDIQRFDSAVEKAKQALALFESFDDKQGRARALTYLGHFTAPLGRKQEAMNLYQDALLLAQNSGDFYAEASLFSGIARTHLDLGDTKAALQFFNLALEKNRALSDRIGMAYTFRSIGHCYFAAGDSGQALAALNQALNIFRSLSNKNREAYVLQDIGIVLEAAGDKAGAMEQLNRSLEVSRSMMDQRLEAWTLTSIAHVREGFGEFDEALEYYEHALRLDEATGDRLGRLTVLYRIAACLRRTGKLQESLARSESALKAIEEFRATVVNSGLRTSYFASVRQQYELMIDILMRLRLESEKLGVRAFETSEQSRARTLLDSIAEARASISEGVDAKQVEREETLKVLLDAKVDRYTQIRGNNTASKAVAELSDEIQRLTAEYEDLRAQIRVRSPHYSALVQPETLRLDQVQNELLDRDSLLLEYSLGDENSYLWAVTRQDFASFTLPKRSEIERKVRGLRDLLTARASVPGEKPAVFQARIKAAEAQYTEVSADLTRVLLGPVADRLSGRRLVIVAEGVLQYLPFGALPTPQSVQSSSSTPLIVEHEIVNLPSASTLAVIRREAPSRGTTDRTIAVFADPVFEASDPRVRKPLTRVSSPQANSRQVAARNTPANSSPQILRGSDAAGIKVDLPRLLSTRQEAEAILAMVPEDRRMGGLGFSATKAAAMNPDLKRYRIVHFATHTVLNDDHPDLSSLVLSLVDEEGNPQSGYLGLRDIYNLHLAAELVVLSACETALGKEVKGEGLMSMVRGFMYSGTPRVLASLWKVDDEATAELMTEFYKHLLQEGMTPAKALRQAQITQMQKRSRQSPYYWAGFQLQGEWN